MQPLLLYVFTVYSVIEASTSRTVKCSYKKVMFRCYFNKHVTLASVKKLTVFSTFSSSMNASLPLLPSPPPPPFLSPPSCLSSVAFNSLNGLEAPAGQRGYPCVPECVSEHVCALLLSGSDRAESSGIRNPRISPAHIQ